VLFVVSAVTGGVLAGWLLGGSLRRLELLTVHRLRLLILAVVTQVVGTVVLAGTLYLIALLASLGLAAAFLLSNPRLAGRGLLLIGLAANALVIALNGAMPVTLTAAARAGLQTGALLDDPRHRPAGPATRLPLLEDRVPLPLPVLPQVLSIGDILVAAGAGLLVCQAMRRRVLDPVPVRVSPPPDDLEAPAALATD
jgi:hypothetical protein